MHPIRLIFLTLILLLIAACASNSTSAPYPPECDISSLRSSDYPHDTWCSIKYAALRCSTKSDKCLVQCEQHGGAKNIGGGCSHICSPRVYTQEDVVANGGEFTPPGSIECANEDVP